MANPERNSTSRLLLGAMSLKVIFQQYLMFSTLRISEGWSLIQALWIHAKRSYCQTSSPEVRKDKGQLYILLP